MTLRITLVACLGPLTLLTLVACAPTPAASPSAAQPAAPAWARGRTVSLAPGESVSESFVIGPGGTVDADYRVTAGGDVRYQQLMHPRSDLARDEQAGALSVRCPGLDAHPVRALEYPPTRASRATLRGTEPAVVSSRWTNDGAAPLTVVIEHTLAGSAIRLP